MRGFLPMPDRMRVGRAPLTNKVLLTMAYFLASLAGVGVILPATASADAAIAPPSLYSAAPGLPDGRVYEQVSPTDKNGNEAGAGTDKTLSYGGIAHYSLAAPDGNGILFEGSGPMGDATSGYTLYFEAQRSTTGWSTRAILPRTQEPTTGGTITVQPYSLDSSSDLSHVMFQDSDGFAPPPYPKCSEGIYLSDPDPMLAATWLGRPQISNPAEACGGKGELGAPVGGTPNFSTAYFTYAGTLLPEDASRAPHASKYEPEYGPGARVEAWGFYAYTSGTLSEAGVLPDGSLDPFGAVPARSRHGRALYGNQVSLDGSRAFFVSPDPASCGRENNCAVNPPELYVRENGERTLLVSEDSLLPQVGGLPAPAPHGVLEAFSSTGRSEEVYGSSHFFASPDGSQAFFQSEDDLTKSAEEASPGTQPKMYDFDVSSGSLTYLPNVTGAIVTSGQDGSSFAFVSPESGSSPPELELWSAGPSGGTVTPITQLSSGITVARMSSNGSAVVFQTSAAIAGFNNGGTHNVELAPGSEQIYRYYTPTNTLSCVSCPPAGVTPSSNAELSPLQAAEAEGDNGSLSRNTGMVEEHGISSDGNRVFFDTADPLVPQDSNTGSITRVGRPKIEQVGRDVYEWENGAVYLISSGRSPRNSFFLDSSESGGDVFFATEEGLSIGDTDGAYDVYDARIPHVGDNPPPAAVPCEGSVCQGPPRVPAPLGAPASATFSGLGNVVSPSAKPATKRVLKSLTKAQKLSAALRACEKQAMKKRAKCESLARKKYASKVNKSTRRGK